jgi:hypothetical protein
MHLAHREVDLAVDRMSVNETARMWWKAQCGARYLASRQKWLAKSDEAFGLLAHVLPRPWQPRQYLLEHRDGLITMHYALAELTSLIEAAGKVSAAQSRKSPATAWLRHKNSVNIR